jgi:hypothetical protein
MKIVRKLTRADGRVVTLKESDYQRRRQRLALEGVDGDEDLNLVTYWYTVIAAGHSAA